MFSCPTCGHQNLPSFSVCARCGAHLAGAINDPIAAMAAEQARSRKRSRVIYSAAAVIGLAALAVFAVRDRMTKAAVGQKLQWLDSWAEKDKLEVGALWNCLTQSNTPLDSFATAGQVQAKVEQAAGVQPKTFAEHLRLECGPMGERVVSVFATSDPVPAEFQPGFEAFKASLPKLKDGIATFAERLDTLVQGGNLASKLQTAGEAWHASQSPTVESVAFEKFLQCAVPGIAGLADAQALLQTLAEQCYKKDAAAFMQTVQDKCGSLIMKPELSIKPSATYKASMKKFYEPEQRMMKAWEDCVRKGRKGGRDNNLAQFLHAFGQYMEARVQIALAAKAIKDAS